MAECNGHVRILTGSPKKEFLHMRSENVAEDADRYPPIAIISIPRRKSLSPNAKEVVEVLNL